MIKNFHLVDLRKLPIPLPPLEVQQEIVKKLESMLSKIKEAKELIKEAKETFKNRKASILHKAFTGELTKEWRNEDADSAFESLRHRKPDTEALEVSKPQTVMEMLQGIIDDSNTPPSRASGIAKKKGAKSIEEMLVPEDEHPYEIPEGWEWVKLGSIINLISGQDISAINCNDKKIGTPYILGASNITNNIFTPTRWIESPKIISVKNDILVSVKGTIGELYLQKEEKINISRQIMAIRMISNDIHLSYINYFLVFYVKQLQEKSRGVIPGLAREDILKTDLPLPPLEEQKQIVKILESLLEKEEKALSLLKMEKDLELLEKSILAKAFRGELTGNTDHTRTSRASVSASGETAMELLERVLREKHSLPPKATTGKTCKDAAPLRLKTTDSTLNEKPKNNTPKKTSGKNDIKPLKKNKEGKLF